MTTSRPTLACTLALAVAACSGDNGSAPAVLDGGVVIDASTPDGTLSSGTGTDASTGNDSGNEAGVSSDARADVASPADGGATSSDASSDACVSLPTVPDLTTGAWLICNATDDAAGRIWTGTLTIATETTTCSGATLAGSFHWVSNMGADGTTSCTGTYDAVTHVIVLDEHTVTGGSGVATATDTMTFDPATSRLVNGSWQPGSGMWAAATRVAADAGAVCGDGG